MSRVAEYISLPGTENIGHLPYPLAHNQNIKQMHSNKQVVVTVAND